MDDGWDYWIALNNCLLTDIGSMPGYDSGSGNYISTSSSSGIYQTVGAGEFYLAAGSLYRDAGIGSIDSALAADLETMTTYPPRRISSEPSVDRGHNALSGGTAG